ncbi:MAG: DUF3347 domain-containing protein [Oligoflexia bacterium]|nr:DUF3347 domain-containing protein [Oligoflexia bacterium]
MKALVVSASIVSALLLSSVALAAGADTVLPHYLKIQQTLAKDSLDGVADAAKAIVGGTKDEKIAQPARALAEAKDLDAARKAFKALSVPMTTWASVAKPAEVQTVFCSMANARWLQKKGGIRNPYYGSGMLECGEVQN